MNITPYKNDNERAVPLNEAFIGNADFYPTVKALGHKMLDKVDFKRPIYTILEPSAGKGDLIEIMQEYGSTKHRYSGHTFNRAEILAIEKDPDLMSTLLGKGHKVIDTDFLSYFGGEQFDLIVMNPPFSEGAKHLIKAIDILYSGQIVCLLNAETLKNPYSNERKELLLRLDKLNADIEYMNGQFNGMDSQRRTDVEIAIVYISVVREAEFDLFEGMAEECENDPEFKRFEEKEMQTLDDVHNLVARFNRERSLVTESVLKFYENHRLISPYLSLLVTGEKQDQYSSEKETLTMVMKKKMNYLNKVIKKRFWYQAFDLREIASRMTSKNNNQVGLLMERFSLMEFNESNIHQLIINVINQHPQLIEESVHWMFEELCRYALKERRVWGYEECERNVHYFNAWKSNSGYMINPKIILPNHGYNRYGSKCSLARNTEQFINDLSKVLSYFDGHIDDYRPGKVVEEAFGEGVTRDIHTRYFKVSIYKKGTLHIHFSDLNLLRKFNIEACRERGWLPSDYGFKPWKDMNDEEQEVAHSFEAKYEPIRGGLLQISSPFPKLFLPASA